MDKIILSRKCGTRNGPVSHTKGIYTRPMMPLEQREHHRHIIGRANQSATAENGFADNSLFFKTVVQEAHTFTDKNGVEWAVGLIP